MGKRMRHAHPALKKTSVTVPACLKKFFPSEHDVLKQCFNMLHAHKTFMKGHGESTLGSEEVLGIYVSLHAAWFGF